MSPPKAGKTTLLKAVAKSIVHSNPNMHAIILLIDERPEEVTDIKEAIRGKMWKLSTLPLMSFRSIIKEYLRW